MYRRASKMDLDDISKLPGINKSVDELEKYLQKGYKFLYVYENAVNNIIGASLFGADDIDDDSYDSEIYGIYTRNVKDKESITAEILFDTKQELFNLGYRNLIVWCEELDLSYNAVVFRLNNGWSIEKALTKKTPTGFKYQKRRKNV